jgi:hypothetical protein
VLIRSAQMAAFSESAIAAFENRLALHLHKCFPAECEAGGEQKVRETIRYGIERAATYGITAHRDVCKYIDLMFVYGRDFDTDPRLAWPSAVLSHRAMRTPTLKLETLYEAGIQHEQAVKHYGRP